MANVEMLDIFADVDYGGLMRYELNFSHLQAVIRAIIEKLKNVERAANAVPDINGLVNANEDLRRQVALLAVQTEQQSGRPFLDNADIMQQAERDWPQAVAEQAVQVNKDQTDMKGALRLLASWLQQRRNLALPVVPVADGALGSADESAAGDAEAQAELVPQREQNIAQQVDLLQQLVDQQEKMAAEQEKMAAEPDVVTSPVKQIPGLQNQNEASRRHLDLVLLRLQHPGSSSEESPVVPLLPDLPPTSSLSFSPVASGKQPVPDRAAMEAALDEMQDKMQARLAEEGIPPLPAIPSERPGSSDAADSDAARLAYMQDQIDQTRYMLWLLYWKATTPETSAVSHAMLPGLPGSAQGAAARASIAAARASIAAGTGWCWCWCWWHWRWRWRWLRYWCWCCCRC